MDGIVGISAALHPFLAERPSASRSLAERIEEEIVTFCSHRGLPVDEERGRRVALVPAGQLDPGLAWAFVADHLVTHVSRPVEDLCRAGRLFARALRAAGERGAMTPDHARACAHAAEAAVAELPRLDQLARGLRATLGEGRPGRELWETDPEAYARAMQRWESQQPLAQEELEGGFVVDAVEEGAVRLYHRRREEPIELRLPPAIARLLREGDRLDVQLGRNREGWFLMDVWAAAAPAPRLP
jgi:hypothetical protein